MTIYICADHGGYTIKEKIKSSLIVEGKNVYDFGALEQIQDDDFADYVVPCMKKMQEDKDSFGIVICRNGVGVSLLANKFKGIRAGLCFNKTHVKSARNDDNINVLAIPADYVSEIEVYEMVDSFLETPFSAEERFSRRLQKVSEMESEQFK